MSDRTDNKADRQRRIRRSALLFGGIAVAFYVGFIALSALSG